MVPLELLSRAAQEARDLGHPQLGTEHLLLALGATPERVLEELGRLGVEVPKVPLPYRPSWGPTFHLSREEFERLDAELRRRGVL